MEFVWTRLKRWALSIARQFSLATPVLLGLAVALALLGIWWLGPHWQWRGEWPLAELSIRVLATVLVLVAPLLLWSLSLRRRHALLQTERQRALAVVADPGLAHVEAQQRAMDRKLANFIENAGGKRSLHRLPWYLLLGESNAGKTSFVSRSGQNFSLTQVTRGDREIPDKNLAYPIEWWISSDAVLIDPPGEFLSSGNSVEAFEVGSPAAIDRRLWTHLLQWLGEQRSRRALNGIVLVVDIHQLLEQPERYCSESAYRVRSCLHELTQELGTRLPLYVVWSKFDLLPGFEELFKVHSADPRFASAGFTFSLGPNDGADAWLDEFDIQFGSFIDFVNERVFDAMSNAPSQRVCARLVQLQTTLAAAQATVRSFFEQALGSDRYTTPALVRGVYLTSVLQKGEANDLVADAISRMHHLDKPAIDAKPKAPNLTYFTQSLFQKAIYPEAGLAGDNIKVARSKRKVLLAGSAVATLGALLSTAGWHHYFAVNRDQATTVLTRSQAFGVSAVDTREDASGRNLLTSLDPLRSALAVYGDYRDAWPGVSDFGLYQGRVIGPTVDEAYLSLLSRQFLPAIATGVLERMDAAPEGSDEQLAALRVYRMIEDRGNRQPEVVMDWMARHWQAIFPGEGAVQAALVSHLAYALKYADAQLPQHRQRVADVQQQLRQVPMAQRVYRSLKQHARGHLHKDMDLRNEIGPAFDVIYQPALPNQFHLPAVLTARGYREYFEPRSDDLARLALVDQWVLGERGQLDYSDEDLKALASRLRGLYSADYIDSWRRMLNGLTVTDFSDLTHGVAVLEEVTGPTAPLRRLLETISDNAQLATPALPLPSELAGHVPALPSQQATLGREFSALVKLLEEKGDKPAYYEEVLGSINGLYDYAKGVHDSPDRGKAALAAVLARFALNSPDPVSALQRTAASLPEPLNLQVRKLADQTAQVLMVEALRELEKRWHSDVYTFYQQRLAGRYPLTANGSDASLEDFEAFFGPQGRLQQFQDQYLNVFVRDNLDALKSANHGGYLVRDEVLEQLRAAERIRETFFDNRGGLGVQFSLEPLGLSGNKRSSVLALDGQLIPYSHGPSQRIGLIWPNTLTAGPGSKLALVHAAGNSSSLGFQGPWSLFRLLSSAQLYGHTATSVDLSFRIGDGVMRYRVSAEKALNPFTLRPFKGFELPRTLLQSEGLQAAR